MIASGPGMFPNAAAYDQQNIQRLKGLGSAFSNLGYQGQLGTKQLQRLASTLASFPEPAAPVVSAPWTPHPVQPVSDRAGFVDMGSGPTMNFNPVQTWQADPFKAMPPPKASTGPRKTLGRALGLSRGGGGGGGGGGKGGGGMGASSTPYQSDLAQNRGLGLSTAGGAGGGENYKAGPGLGSEGSLNLAGGSNPPGSLPATSPGMLGLSAKEGATATTSHGRLAATGPTLTQRSAAQNAALPNQASYGPVANPEGAKTAELRAAWEKKQPKPGAPKVGAGKGKGK
jgi:hypothetical protein